MVEKMAVSVELDPVFRQALKFLHSSNNDAAENIRKALDDVIKQKHGPNKMLINTLSKKYIAEESKATGSGITKSSSSSSSSTSMRRSSNNKSSDSSSSSPVQIIAVTTNSGTAATTVITTDSSGHTQEIPVIISLPDTPPTVHTTAIATAVDDNAMDTHINNSFFDDLACVICRRIDLSAKNRLIECTRCSSLYHQECHNPVIIDADLANGQESTWLCSNCKVKRFKSSATIGSPQSKSHHSSSPTSSSSSNSDVIITGTIGAAFNSGHHSSSSSTTTTTTSRKDKDREHSSSSKSKSSSSSSSRHHSSHHHSSSSSSSRHHERSGEKSTEKGNSSSSSSSSGGGKSSSITPNIHIISADKRLQNMKKKAAQKTQESKRKK